VLTQLLSTVVTPRAPALSRDERREALVAATVPLVRDHGVGVTTAQIASAAGVAEGTIFRAFDSKDELLHAAVARAFDLSHLEAALAGVDPDLPLERRLEQAVGLVQAHLIGFVSLMGRLAASGAHQHHSQHAAEAHEQRRQASRRVHEAMLRVIGADAGRLSVGADRVVDVLGGAVLASIHPMSTDTSPFTPSDLVRVVLHGALAPPGTDPATATDTTDEES
jgi:AcrR family transcriptional regulator